MRNDIQALRGWAVLLVVLDHADIGPFHAGFLGVDIFFVISGFLITGQLARSIDSGEFTFRDFYFKRARRILPAAYATIVLTCIGAIWFLSSTEMGPLRAQVLGATGFFINFVLWEQADYFAAEASLKPLLHMWSLAIEEQYYILAPLMMFAVPVRFWKASAVLMFAASLVFCLVWVRYDPTGAFYMLPSRAWELLVGSMGALIWAESARSKEICRKLFWPSIAILAVAPALTFNVPHPGFQALAVCAATLVVILAERRSVAATPPAFVLARAGDISYSLYLAHWPVMAFVYATYLGEPTIQARGAAVLIALVVTLMLYFLVEQPVRRRAQKPSTWFASLSVTACLLTIASYFVSAYASKTSLDFAALRAPNYGLDKACDFSGKAFKPRPQCSTGPEPQVLVWGDSYAMHLVPGLVNETRENLQQATFSACSPVLGLAPKRDLSNGEIWADRCLSFNRDVLTYLTETPSIKTVVLGSPWRRFMDENSIIWDSSSGEKVERNAGPDLTFQALSKTVSTLQALGQKVVMFTPPPALPGVDTSACVERVSTGKLVLGRSGCDIDKVQALRLDAKIYELASRLKKAHGITVAKISDALCAREICATTLDGAPVYRDGGHLSSRGSIAVMKRLDIEQLLKP